MSVLDRTAIPHNLLDRVEELERALEDLTDYASLSTVDPESEGATDDALTVAAHLAIGNSTPHHTPVTLGGGSDAALALVGQQLTLANVLTPAEHTAIGDGAPHHTAVTLDANADTILSVTGQALGLDTQVKNTVLSGPAAGIDAKPTFRVLVEADIPTLPYVRRDGTLALTGAWDAGGFKITALQFESDIVTGTAPIIVASTTLVANLNADLLDGEEGAYYLALTNATGHLALSKLDDWVRGSIIRGGAADWEAYDAKTLRAVLIGTGNDLESRILETEDFPNPINYVAPTELTIAAGQITVTKTYHTVDTQDDDPTDDLTLINGGTEGDILVLRPANGARTVVVKHGVGNIWLIGGADVSLDDLDDHLQFIYNGGDWCSLGDGGGAGGAGDVVGPGAATDDAIATYDGATGKLIQGSLVLIRAAGGLILYDHVDEPPLNITERAAAPTAPVANDVYMDDGTNTGSSLPGWRRYTGAAWEDVSAGGGGGGATDMIEIQVFT